MNDHVRLSVVFEGHAHLRRDDFIRPDGRVHHFLRDKTIEPWAIDDALALYSERVAYVGRDAALHEVLAATAPMHGRESKRDYLVRKDRLLAAIRKAGRNVRKAKSPGGIPASIKQSKNARRKRLRYGKG